MAYIGAMSIAHPDIITDEQIAHLVCTFYGRARTDEVIGPIFDRAVHDWDHHIAQITDFWSSMLLKTGRYSGRPMRPHLVLKLAPEHFDRWLKLFEATATELFAPELAAEFIIRARRIADSFEMGIATTQGKVATPRHSV
ncbi:preprotein translocase subunit TatC [Rhodopseudomonas palustris]|uniref:Preprotein translocase subunit TatC n=1 Tax=Rhodopseudomonas palustris TaxID=1076 RepID=A0A323UN88_RHOPL|nr:group III truncated hemoglobin [Rhodopseudomonas palustris]PZA13849.1 preprotein translocase subunit TatC [Rhodopseudomonas palustris]